MNAFHKKLLLFLVFCIGTRTLVAYLAKNANKTYLRYMGYLALLPALGFLFLYFTGVRKVGVFGEKIWWNDLRPVHALLYLLFSYNAIRGKSFAWVFLLMDMFIGLFSFLFFYRSHF